MRIESRLLVAILLLLFALGLDVSPSSRQEKKSIRFVTVSLGWNSALPFRVTIARGLFKQQGLQVEATMRAQVLQSRISALLFGPFEVSTHRHIMQS